MTSAAIIACPGCLQPIGSSILINGVAWLLLNDVVVRSLHGACARCGTEIHYSVSDKSLAVTIQHAIKIANGKG